MLRPAAGVKRVAVFCFYSRPPERELLLLAQQFVIFVFANYRAGVYCSAPRNYVTYFLPWWGLAGRW